MRDWHSVLGMSSRTCQVILLGIQVRMEQAMQACACAGVIGRLAYIGDIYSPSSRSMNMHAGIDCVPSQL